MDSKNILAVGLPSLKVSMSKQFVYMPYYTCINIKNFTTVYRYKSISISIETPKAKSNSVGAKKPSHKAESLTAYS